MRRWIGWSVVAVLVAGGAVALVRSGDRPAGTRSSDASTSAAGGASTAVAADGISASAPVDQARAPESVRKEMTRDESGPAALGDLPDARARIVKHGELTLEVRGKVFERRYAEATRLAEYFGGFVETSDRRDGSGSLTMRVPAARFGEAVTALAELGTVTGQNERGEDVTGQVVDLDARIRNQRAEEAVLVDLMGRAESTTDALAVRAQLAAVREQVEQLTAQRDLLDDQASFSTIAVGFRVVGAAATTPAPAAHSTLSAAWDDAVGAALAIVAGTMVVLGVLIPLGLIVGAGALAWWAVARRRGRVGPVGA